MAHPLWDHDRPFLKTHPSLIGIDEVGRGAFAGPVVAAGVWATSHFFCKRSLHKATKCVNDSKTLSAKKRATIFDQALRWEAEGFIRFAVAEASVEEIATFNILGATTLAMKRVLEKLGVPSSHDNATLPLFLEQNIETPSPLLLIDGKPIKNFPWAHRGVIKGDSKSLSIALASIIAKVTRDRLMVALGARYPAYGFEGHKGYGTPSHRAVIEKVGPCPHHRLDFIKDSQAHNNLEFGF